MDTQNHFSAGKKPDKTSNGAGIALFAILHVLCCGLPLLAFSGVSITAFFSKHPVLAVILAEIGLVSFIWYVNRGFATCPRNEDRCTTVATTNCRVESTVFNSFKGE